MRLRRYSNRTLWDADKNVQVSLSDVARAIRRGEKVTAAHASKGKSGKDCTALVLIQLLYEDAMRGVAIPHEPLLKLLQAERPGRAADALKRLQDEAIRAGSRSSSPK